MWELLAQRVGQAGIKDFLKSCNSCLSLEYQSSLCYPREQWGCRLLYVPRIGRDREGVTKSASICSILPVCWRIGVEIFEIKVNVFGMTIPKICGTYQWRIFLKKKQSIIERWIELSLTKINTCIKWSKRRESIYIKVSHVHICIHVNHCVIDIIFIVCTSVCSSPVHMNVYSSPKVYACMLVK